MTRPTLHVVEGGGKPEPDEESLERGAYAKAAIDEAVAAGRPFWSMVETEEGYFQCTYCGDGLELAATVEEVARDQKRFLLGLDGE